MGRAESSCEGFAFSFISRISRMSCPVGTGCFFSRAVERKAMEKGKRGGVLKEEAYPHKARGVARAAGEGAPSSCRRAGRSWRDDCAGGTFQEKGEQLLPARHIQANAENNRSHPRDADAVPVAFRIQPPGFLARTAHHLLKRNDNAAHQFRTQQARGVRRHRRFQQCKRTDKFRTRRRGAQINFNRLSAIVFQCRIVCRRDFV